MPSSLFSSPSNTFLDFDSKITELVSLVSNAFQDDSDVFLGFRSPFAFNTFLNVFDILSEWASFSFNAFLNVSDVSLEFGLLFNPMLFWMFLIYFPELSHSMLLWMSRMYLQNGSFSPVRSIQCFSWCVWCIFQSLLYSMLFWMFMMYLHKVSLPSNAFFGCFRCIFQSLLYSMVFWMSLMYLHVIPFASNAFLNILIIFSRFVTFISSFTGYSVIFLTDLQNISCISATSPFTLLHSIPNKISITSRFHIPNRVCFSYRIPGKNKSHSYIHSISFHQGTQFWFFGI